MNVYILFALLAVASSFVAESIADCSGNSHELPNKKLVKSFAKISDYLEENVESDDFELNIGKAKEWLKEKSKLSLLLDPAFKGSLKVITRLPDVVANDTICGSGWSQRMLEMCDGGLADEAHVALLTTNDGNSKNYPLKRIERILQSVAYKNVRMCRLRSNDAPRLGYTFKEYAYNHINGDLVDNAPNDDPETNMKAAEMILARLEDQSGGYAAALKQLLSLRSIQTEDSCNEQGVEIVLKNDLANGGRGLDWAAVVLRRVSKVIKYYVSQHSKVCTPIYQRQCLALLDQLDSQTYRRVLGLASSFYLPMLQFEDLTAEVESKQVGQDFTTKRIVLRDESRKISDPSVYENEKLFGYLRVATKQDPRTRFLKKVVDEKQGQMVVMPDEIKHLFDEYIYEPCAKFNSLMESIMEIHDYLWQTIKAEQVAKVPLNFRLLRSAYHSCMDVIYHRDCKLEQIKMLVRS